MTNAEVMAFAIISSLHYRADYRTTRLVVSALRYFPKILSHSHLVRRIHAIPEQMWWMIFYVLKMLPCEQKDLFCFADRAYNTYSLEDDLREMAEFLLVPRRKKNMTRQHSPNLEFILNHTRNRIETVFSAIISKIFKMEKSFDISLI